MIENIGLLDLIIRLILAISAATLIFTDVVTGVAAFVLLAIMSTLLVTSFFRCCPIYGFFRVTTN